MLDVIVLGGGPAGYHGAERAAKAGLTTLLIEKGFLGGVCLNEGCIPSKTLLHSSKLFSLAKNSQAYGITASNVALDLSKVMARKQKLIEMHRRGIAAGLKKTGVVVETGSGFILPRSDSFTVRVAAEAGEKVFQGKRLLICTGSEAVRLPIPGAEQPFVVTSREILSAQSLPKNLVVIGAGVIGLELAVFFAEAGVTVTVIELLPDIGGTIDKEIGLLLKRELEKTTIRFLLQTRVTSFGDHSVKFESEGGSGSVPADLALVSVGRRPAIAGLGLENIGIEAASQAIATDENGRTSVPDVWAAGDVNGRSMLAHTAYREADVCVDDMMGGKSSVNYDAIAQVMYTHPEVASAGLSQEEAQKRGIDALVAKLPLSYNGRYGAENEGGRGICKVVLDKKTRSLLGVHMLGGPCSEMIFGAALMIDRKMTAFDIDGMVFPHPTVSEIIKDAVTQALPVTR
jgi:dihydrolipoamide dehydrogenase